MPVGSRARQPVVLGRLTGHAATVTVRGDLDLTGMPALQQRLGEILARGPERLVFDLSETSFIDCACARVLVAAGHALPGGMPVIRRATPAVRRVLELTGLSACCHVGDIPGVTQPTVPV